MVPILGAKNMDNSWEEKFNKWMKQVDNCIAKKLGGLKSDDLPDICYADYFDDGMSPGAAAKEAIKNVTSGEYM